jgi:hypothetical protein
MSTSRKKKPAPRKCPAPTIAGDTADLMVDERAIDLVNHPPHYNQSGKIECIQALREMLGLDGFIAHCRAVIVKYSWRNGLKESLQGNDQKIIAIRDFRKAAWYANRAADELEASMNIDLSTEG